VKHRATLWQIRVRGLDAARKSVKRGDPEGLHDLRVALRRIGVTAAALGREGVARRARCLSRSLSRERQLEVDRRLLERIGRIGFLSPDAVTALAARWEKLAGKGARRLARAVDGGKFLKLRRRLERLARSRSHKGPGGGTARIEAARRRAEDALARPLEGKDDRTLHRYRLAVKRARYLAEDLAVLGLPEQDSLAVRERAIQEALGRWHDLRMFRRRLAKSRDDAEVRGAVMLAGEIAHLLASLEPAIASVRATAVAASRRPGNVVPLRLAAG
jgi:CHAD domain-containing protein